MLMFWLVAALLCLLTVCMLLASKSSSATEHTSHSDGALAIYKDQLLELDRDIASGTLNRDEAEAHRTEISRRLLTAGREIIAASTSTNKFPKLAVLIIPAAAAAMYFYLGRYDLPDVPRAERLAAAETSNDWAAMIARVEEQLEKDPKDVQGWKLLLPHYRNLGRFGDAARALDRIAAIEGPSADIYADMAEAYYLENKGLMTAQTIAIVGAALKLDPTHAKARFYQATSLVQDGKPEEAKTVFQNMLETAPADAPWRASVEEQLSLLAPNSAAPKISAKQMQGAENLAPDDRMAMIRGMVEGLDEKLKTNPENAEGWLRLIRARTVLNETDKAQAALATARSAFAVKPDQLKALDELAKELNLK